MRGEITGLYKDKGKNYVPKSKEQELATFVATQYKVAEGVKQSIIEESWMAVAFFSGRQWARWNTTTRVLEEPQPPPWRVRMVLNYVQPTVEALVGKLTENRPGFIVLPATDDDDDAHSARQSEKVLDHVWDKISRNLKIHEFCKWMVSTGTAFLKVWWDSTAGEEYEFEAEKEVVEYIDEKTGEAVMPEPELKTERAKTGFPVVDVLSVLDVAWDPGAKDLEEARWVIHANSMHIDKVRDLWKKGKHVEPDYAHNADQYSASIIKEFAGQQGSEEKFLDRVLVLEYFERSSPRHPKGRYIVTAGGIVLEQDDELPYGDIPIVMARHITSPGKLAGEGVVKALIPAQKELNKSVSQRIENKNLHANPKWLVEKGSIERHHFTDQPGEIVQYSRNATRPPQPMPPPPLSPEHRMIQEEQIAHIQAISGVSDIMRGAIPSGISGRAIGLLSDIEQTQLGPTVRELEVAIQRSMARILRYWRDYMPIEQTIRVSGKAHALEVFKFHSSEIRSTDVKVESNSMLPKHPSYRREQIMQAFQVGLIGDPADPQTRIMARKMMEFGDRDIIEGDNSRDRSYAREEIITLAQGLDADVQPWEDHMTHIDEHLSFMKSLEFRLLSPDVQENFTRHLAWHYYSESQAQQGQPWWQSFVEGGVENLPPAETPEDMAQEAGMPPMPPMPPGGEMPGGEMPPGMEMPGGEMPGMAPPGMMGGGTPELNQAITTRGPGRPDYEFGFEAGSV